MQFSYEGFSDSGLFDSIKGLLGGIAPKQTPFAFHARNGLEYVPYDGFPIIAHKGERVQTATEATEWRSGNSRLADEVRALRDDLNKIGFTLAKNTNKVAKYIERWDGLGLPAERVLA